VVSIGLPTFNRDRALERAIASVLAQDYRDIELVISDNASTDGTAALCRRHAEADARVRYFAQPVNRGPVANFIEVLQRARGELFMWLGDDDWLDASYVRLCVEALRADPALSLVGGAAKYYTSTGSFLPGYAMNLTQDSPAARVLRYYASVGDNAIFYGVMPRELARRVACRSCLGGDWLFVAAMAYLGKVKTLDETALHRELGGASASRASIAEALGLPAVQFVLPFSSVAANAALDIAHRNPVYRERPAIGRGLLACAVLLQVLVSKGLVLNFKLVAVRLMRRAMGDERYRRLRERIR
jgi:glycosyltransferase involved in cell wall biosynthesis